ncbi:MAG: hypothetical protein U0324_09250 [Polyangiales bacterium]
MGPRSTARPAPAAFALTVAFAVAGCPRRRGPTAFVRVAAQTTLTRADGDALYLLDGLDAVRATERGVRRVSLRGRRCLLDERLAGVELVPLGDGRRALASADAPNMAFDLFGHAGRHPAVRCVVDFDRGTAEPVDDVFPRLSREAGPARRGERVTGGASGRLYRAPQYGPLTAVDTATGVAQTLTPERGDASRCAVAEAGSMLTVACPDEAFDRAGEYATRTLRVRRFRVGVGALEPAGEAATPIAMRGLLGGLTLSPDGRVAVYWGASPTVPDGANEVVMSAVSTDDGRVRFTERRTMRGYVTAAAALPDGRGVLVGDDVERRGRLRWLRLDGTVAQTWALDDVPWGLHATARADRAWVVCGGDASLVRIAP